MGDRTRNVYKLIFQNQKFVIYSYQYICGKIQTTTIVSKHQSLFPKKGSLHLQKQLEPRFSESGGHLALSSGSLVNAESLGIIPSPFCSPYFCLNLAILKKFPKQSIAGKGELHAISYSHHQKGTQQENIAPFSLHAGL